MWFGQAPPFRNFGVWLNPSPSAELGGGGCTLYCIFLMLVFLWGGCNNYFILGRLNLNLNFLINWDKTPGMKAGVTSKEFNFLSFFRFLGPNLSFWGHRNFFSSCTIPPISTVGQTWEIVSFIIPKFVLLYW